MTRTPRTPGDGLDVARWLAERGSASGGSGGFRGCPVVIHTSNADRGFRMQGVLEGAGWECRRVAPVGSDWIEADWVVVAGELVGLGKAASVGAAA